MAVSLGSGAGSNLPASVLILSGISTCIAVFVSSISILMHLKNYRKPALQRMVVRIMVMVPVYAVSSLIALHSLEAAFVIDALRDIYEAFVIYCFFVLLLSYLGGERSLLILLHGRPPKDAPFPLNLFRREVDVSDPYTLLFLKRGILQYVQVKPVLAAVTLILKAVGKYNEGDFKANSGYLYVSIVYNASICLALYCLAVFWLCVNEDLKPFRPVPKFLCVKGILFFSFWQSIAISTLVATDIITKLGPYTDPEHISVGLNDTLICLEMPFFAIAHMYAFSHRDYIDPKASYVARMPVYYAFRDAFGLLDVVEDTKTTLRGEGMDYREFEPAEGLMHQGDGRARRIRAGLRYSKGGRRKYWLPKPTKDTQPPDRFKRGVNRIIERVAGPDHVEDVHAPLLPHQVDRVVHLAPDLQDPDEEADFWDSVPAEAGFELPFGDLDADDEELYEHSRKYLFGDYNYPCIDISSDTARITVWDGEERILRDERRRWLLPGRPKDGSGAPGYGAVGSAQGDLMNQGRGDRRVGGPGGEKQRTIINGQDPGYLKRPRVDSKGKKGLTPSFSSSNSVVHGHQTGASPGPSSSLGGKGTGTDPNAPSQPRSWTNYHSHSHTHHTPVQSKSLVQVLPPDAVDLVVEDRDAELENQMRRKGEPGGVRKVYRRGFAVASGDEGFEGRAGEGAVGGSPDEEEEVDEGRAHTTEMKSGGVSAVDTDGGESEQRRGRRGSHTISNAEDVLVRAVTPPLHARLLMDEYEDHNPWA